LSGTVRDDAVPYKQKTTGTLIVIISALVDEGAILDAVFEKFHHQPPPGFERIMIEKTVL
jgi:hypothetical protein